MGLGLTYVAEFHEGRQITRYVAGDAKSFGFEIGSGALLEHTYCKRMAASLIPNVINDATQDPRVACLETTKDSRIGAYIGVPLCLPDGTLYGTFCCLSHEPDPSLDERAVRFLALLADVMVEDLQVERER